MKPLVGSINSQTHGVPREPPAPLQQGIGRWLNLQLLRQGTFVRNVLTVMSGTAVAQLIAFGFAPLLSRLYGPVDFGLFGAYLSVVGVLGAAATLNYADVVMLPKEDADGAKLLLVACWSAGLVALVTAGFSLLASAKAWHVVGLDDPGAVRWLLPISVLLVGWNQALTSWCARLKAFQGTSQAQVIRSTTVCGAQAGLAFGVGGSTGLISGTVAGDACALVRLAWSALAQRASVFRAGFRWQELKCQAREYREFAVYGTPQNVMNALSQGLPVLILIHYYGAAVGGWYAFGIRLLQVPMNFILTSIRQVLFQKLSHIGASGGDLYRPFTKATGVLVAICVLPAALGFVVAPALFATVFGEQWRVAGEYARWLVLWLAPMFCNVPSTLVARILRLQRDLFLLDVFLLAARAAILVAGGIWLQPLYTIIGLSTVGAGFNVGFIFYVAHRLRKCGRAAAGTSVT